jgi:ubiquinone/menaquinone biosynthesis C-methylase UbiE
VGPYTGARYQRALPFWRELSRRATPRVSLPMSIKEFFRNEWAGVADAWGRWGEQARAQSAGATAWLMELVRVEPGLRVLDLASGVGEPALELARRVGPSGRVMATDLVEGALAMLRSAANGEGLTWLETAVADMERLPFDDATFDAVTCRLGLMFCPQPGLALAEVRRVLRPGGRAAFIVWSSPEQALFASTLGVFTELGSAEVVSPKAAVPTPAVAPASASAPTCVGAPGPFRFAPPGSLAAELQRAGFSSVREEQRQIAWPFEGSAELFWEMFADLAGPTYRAALAELGPEQQRELAARVIRNLNGFRKGSAIDPTALLVGCSGER